MYKCKGSEHRSLFSSVKRFYKISLIPEYHPLA
jgi:hypothetical protein